MKKITQINYQINFDRCNTHLADVTMIFDAPVDAPVVWLPSWLPGSYLMREFSRHITAVHYQVETFVQSKDDVHIDDSQQRPIESAKKNLLDVNIKNDNRATKLSKNEWQLNYAQAGDKVSIRYEVYCYDLSVRTAYVDNQRIYGNFSALLLTVAGLEEVDVMATLMIPSPFYQDKSPESLSMACGLPWFFTQDFGRYEFTLTADSYHHLIDHPFEISEQDTFEFMIENHAKQDIPHSFYMSGRHTADLKRLQQDIKKICQSYVDWLGDTPFEDYTFMTYCSGNDYGGLEHINSTSLVIPRNDLPSHNETEEPSESYQRYLGLCSHEYFHSWWVKTVRPDVMMNVDLKTEVYTPLLWVFEGFTSYIDDFMLQSSGIVSPASYLKLLTSQINRYNQTAGRSLQSVAESSFDAWIKLYRADENTGNAGISYYNKGALVALCLDLTMLKETDGKYRLFDVVKAYYERAKQTRNKRIGMTNDNLAEVISRFIDANVWQDFYTRYVIGVDKLPVNQLLAEHGIRIDLEETDNVQAWGMTVTETPNGLLIDKVNRDSVANEAGLSAKDVIVAIDGIKADKKQLKNIAERMNPRVVNRRGSPQYGYKVDCHAFRRDELRCFQVSSTTQVGRPASQSLGRVKLSIGESEPEKAQSWLTALSR